MMVAKLAVGSWQLAVGSGQFAVGSYRKMRGRDEVTIKEHLVKVR